MQMSYGECNCILLSAEDKSEEKVKKLSTERLRGINKEKA
ncbi:hypothetical protein SAMN02745217_00037 [Anaerocolumna xylanovorans DSM 12503]|uniref:Uncharacterized protein n=1 Tax=Anaerocolumna xylanovorans DSM 12503 TaxID=1121345 RepID=A0A1M7XW69_9FIRM|nr:hypothetical protein SAMN02745217_00037 [Anaerocolumna xylanovorans DSM 12503]